MVSKIGFLFSILMSYCCPSRVKCLLALAVASASAFDVLTSFPNARVY